MPSFDIAPRGPLQIGIATVGDGDWVDWLTSPADIRVRGADLREVARRSAAARRDHPGCSVVVDIDSVIASDARTARSPAPVTDPHRTEETTLLYVGTPAGLAGLIADIHVLGIADGAVLIPRAENVTDLIRSAVVPVLATMTGLPPAMAEGCST